jgi:hypothetical protein
MTTSEHDLHAHTTAVPVAHTPPGGWHGTMPPMRKVEAGEAQA